MNLKIHSKGITGSAITMPGEKPAASFGCVIEIDGKIVEEVSSVRVLHRGNEFATVMVRLLPGELEELVHDADGWADLMQRLDQQKAVEA